MFGFSVISVYVKLASAPWLSLKQKRANYSLVHRSMLYKLRPSSESTDTENTLSQVIFVYAPVCVCVFDTSTTYRN